MNTQKRIIEVLMHTNPGVPDRLVYCVVAPSGRIIGEYLTRAAAERRARS